jgi:hypothetical protein
MLQVCAITKRVATNDFESLGELYFDQPPTVFKCKIMNLLDGRIHFHMSHIVWNRIIFCVFVIDEHIVWLGNACFACHCRSFCVTIAVTHRCHWLCWSKVSWVYLYLYRTWYRTVRYRYVRWHRLTIAILRPNFVRTRVRVPTDDLTADRIRSCATHHPHQAVIPVSRSLHLSWI